MKQIERLIGDINSEESGSTSLISPLGLEKLDWSHNPKSFSLAWTSRNSLASFIKNSHAALDTIDDDTERLGSAVIGINEPIDLTRDETESVAHVFPQKYIHFLRLNFPDIAAIYEQEAPGSYYPQMTAAIFRPNRITEAETLMQKTASPRLRRNASRIALSFTGVDLSVS